MHAVGAAVHIVGEPVDGQLPCAGVPFVITTERLLEFCKTSPTMGTGSVWRRNAAEVELRLPASLGFEDHVGEQRSTGM